MQKMQKTTQTSKNKLSNQFAHQMRKNHQLLIITSKDSELASFFLFFMLFIFFLLNN